MIENMAVGGGSSIQHHARCIDFGQVLMCARVPHDVTVSYSPFGSVKMLRHAWVVVFALSSGYSATVAPPPSFPLVWSAVPTANYTSVGYDAGVLDVVVSGDCSSGPAKQRFKTTYPGRFARHASLTRIVRLFQDGSVTVS